MRSAPRIILLDSCAYFRLAPEDLKALAVAYARNFVLISDDRGIQKTAFAHVIECWNSLKRLKLMLDNDRITKEKLIEIVEYWDHQNDLPCTRHALQSEFTNLFGFDCPI